MRRQRRHNILRLALTSPRERFTPLRPKHCGRPRCAAHFRRCYVSEGYSVSFYTIAPIGIHRLRIALKPNHLSFSLGSSLAPLQPLGSVGASFFDHHGLLHSLKISTEPLVDRRLAKNALDRTRTLTPSTPRAPSGGLQERGLGALLICRRDRGAPRALRLGAFQGKESHDGLCC
jgi:hypothetical protein